MSKEIAIAAAVMVRFADDEERGAAKLVTIEIDKGEGMDPLFQCEALWESVEDDWPGWEVGYITNDAAGELAGHRRMWQYGMKDDNPMTARIERYNAEVQERRKARA